MDWKLASRVWINMGWRIALPVAVGAFGGLFLDNKFHTRPLIALIGLGIGTFISFRLVYKLFKQFAEEQKNIKEATPKDTDTDKDKNSQYIDQTSHREG
jgi:F0F1-type ATP synthase assembly protein I